MARSRSAGRAIQERTIEELVPYARNARTHSDQQLAQILASMVEFGFTNPVLADDSGIVAGHGRVLAAARAHAEGITLRYPDGAALPAPVPSVRAGLMVAGRPYTEAPAANDERLLGKTA